MSSPGAGVATPLDRAHRLHSAGRRVAYAAARPAARAIAWPGGPWRSSPATTRAAPDDGPLRTRLLITLAAEQAELDGVEAGRARAAPRRR